MVNILEICFENVMRKLAIIHILSVSVVLQLSVDTRGVTLRWKVEGGDESNSVPPFPFLSLPLSFLPSPVLLPFPSSLHHPCPSDGERKFVFKSLVLVGEF